MKIGIFSANYLPNVGGIERYTYNISKELISRGHSVTVVTSNVFGLENHEISDDIEIYRLPCVNLLNGRYPVYKRNKEFKEIDRELKQHNFDFIVVNARFYFHSLYAVKFAAKNKIPCITIEHGSSHLSVNNRILDYFGGIYEHAFTHFIKKYCKDFYGVSRAACDWSGHFGISSKGTLYNAVDLEAIENQLMNPVCSYREEYGIGEDDIIVTYTGRLVAEKGSYELTKAIDELGDKRVWLFVAGDGDMFEKIKSISNVNEHIKPLGAIDFKHIVALLKQTDIFCLPTVYPEGLPTSVLEAVAARCFVITTRYGGAKELISDSSYGILTDGNSVEELKDALRTAVSDSSYRMSAIQNSYLRLTADFTWKNTTSRLEEIIKSKM